MVSSERTPTGRCIYRGRGGTAGQLPSPVCPSGVALSAIAKPSLLSRLAERLVPKPPMPSSSNPALSPLRWSCGPHTEHCLKKFPRGRIKEERDISVQFSPYCSLCRGSMVHLPHEITTYTLNLFPCFLSVQSAFLFILSTVDYLTFHGPIHSKK